MSKADTNERKVREGIDAMLAEWKEARGKCADAASRRDVPDLLHHLSDFRGACQQHAWRLHFYLFWPKWILVGLLIWLV